MSSSGELPFTRFQAFLRAALTPIGEAYRGNVEAQPIACVEHPDALDPERGVLVLRVSLAGAVLTPGPLEVRIPFHRHGPEYADLYDLFARSGGKDVPMRRSIAIGPIRLALDQVMQWEIALAVRAFDARADQADLGRYPPDPPDPPDGPPRR